MIPSYNQCVQITPLHFRYENIILIEIHNGFIPLLMPSSIRHHK